jgi:hypothetical protein
MWEDPIVKEVHEIRKRLAAEHGFDLKAIFADIYKRQASLGDRLVSPRKPGEPLYGLESQEGAPRTGQEKLRQKSNSLKA